MQDRDAGLRRHRCPDFAADARAPPGVARALASDGDGDEAEVAERGADAAAVALDRGDAQPAQGRGVRMRQANDAGTDDQDVAVIGHGTTLCAARCGVRARERPVALMTAPRPTSTSADPPRGRRAGLGAARRSARSRWLTQGVSCRLAGALAPAADEVAPARTGQDRRDACRPVGDAMRLGSRIDTDRLQPGAQPARSAVIARAVVGGAAGFRPRPPGWSARLGPGLGGGRWRRRARRRPAAHRRRRRTGCARRRG